MVSPGELEAGHDPIQHGLRQQVVLPAIGARAGRERRPVVTERDQVLVPATSPSNTVMEIQISSGGSPGEVTSKVGRVKASSLLTGLAYCPAMSDHFARSQLSEAGHGWAKRGASKDTERSLAIARPADPMQPAPPTFFENSSVASDDENVEQQKRTHQELDPAEWLIGLPSWVIQDGNYVDFMVGQRRRFALQFFSDGFGDADVGARDAKPLADFSYEVSGQVVVAKRDLMMIDFGLLAYADVRGPGPAHGAWVTGRVGLLVDCYSYFEIHAKKRGVPPAVYAWTVTGIWQQTAPFIPAEDARSWKRDLDRLGWRWLDRTDAWDDDDGHAEYLLRCRLEADEPTRHP